VIYVDTSAFYAFVSRDDRDHARVAAAFRSCLEADAILAASSYVVAETMGLVQYRLGVGVVAQFADEMLPLVQIEWMGAGEHEASWRLLREVGKRAFTIVDASTIVLMRRDGATQVLALDPEFERLGCESLPARSGRPPHGRRSGKH